MGVYPNYREVETVKTATGRFINQTDLKERRKVIVLHQKSAEILFDKTHTDPIGQFVNANGVAYQVVGTYNDQGDRNPSEAYIPFSTLQTIYNKGDKLNNIIFTTQNLTSIESNEAFEEEYRRAIGVNHRFDPTDDGAIWIWNRFTDYLRTQSAMGILRTAIWVIGIFTLLSGIVGVSNIMLITVRERTHEFGPGRQAALHPVAHHCGERGHYHRIRLHRHGGGHRGDRVDERGLRQPDRGCGHVRGTDVQRSDGRPENCHPGHPHSDHCRYTGRILPGSESHQDKTNRSLESRLRQLKLRNDN